jgi:hypothetical protein
VSAGPSCHRHFNEAKREIEKGLNAKVYAKKKEKKSSKACGEILGKMK